MRFLLLAAGALFFAVAPAFALTDFNGHWVLDLRASSSPEVVLKRLGASWIERQLGGVVQLQATYKQTPDLLTVTLKGPAFRHTLRRIWRRRATPAAGESVASAAKSEGAIFF
jgi:hypothetical protein